MHRHWLEITEKHPNLTFVVKSEDLQSIEGQIQMITDFAAKFDITAPTHLNTFNKYIGQLGGAAGNAHNREWYNSEGYMLTYSKDNFKYVMELIDPDIAVKLGYEL